MKTEEPVQAAATPRERRRVVLAGVGVAALLAGAGAALWKTRSYDKPAETADLLWTMSFQTPQGNDVQMKALRGRPILLNFWATWCPPCVEEMPLLDAFFRQNVAKGWMVLGLAIDQPSAVKAYLQRTPVAYMIGLAGMQGTELTKSLGNLAGGLPFTVVLGADGTVRHRRMGRVTEDDLKQWSALV